jgi:transposase
VGSRRATKASVVRLSVDERAYLDRLVRRRKVARGDAQRAEIVLLAADGLNNCAIAAKVGVTRQTVRTWRERFAKHRLDGLCDEPRCGAPRKIGDDQIEAIVVKTLEEKPKGATHWSTRDMANASGVSASSVQRIWRAFSLQPHRTETFKLSTDPQFVEKVRDIVGLYASTKRARYRPSIARSRCCRCVQGRSNGARTITSATAPRRCSRASSPR